MSMKKVTDADKLFYFEKNYFTMDGLWMIETEKATDWETALKIDGAVWRKMLRIIIRRIKNYLKIETNTINDLVEILTFRWSVENWDYEILKHGNNDAKIIINTCPYKAIMERNPDRQDKIPLICKDMCIPFYNGVAKDFNPEIQVIRSKYSGLGDKICDFHFKLK